MVVWELSMSAQKVIERKGELVSFEIAESEKSETVYFTTETVDTALRPLAEKLSDQFHNSTSGPFCTALSGPPGCGKSSIAAVLQQFFREKNIRSVVLPLDGFHMENEKLRQERVLLKKKSISLLSIKGAKETYDTEKLLLFLKKLKSGENFYWPLYSRSTHDPVDRGIPIENRNALYLVEGNYLLLDKIPWEGLSIYFNRKIFIASRKRFLRKRIVRRKQKGGYSRVEALSHYRICDRHNINEVMKHSKGFDFKLVQEGKYAYRLC
jgi:pantothenate kinase